MRIILVLAFLYFSHVHVFAHQNPELGKLDPDRSSYDLKHYSIYLKLYPSEKHIEGTNTISFRMLRDANIMRLDLAAPMLLGNVEMDGKLVARQHIDNKIFLHFNRILKKDSLYTLKIKFEGNPLIAVKPPWNGGFVWSKDNENHDWVGLACESIGASVWLPCKDHWSDEADSMDMVLSVPNGMTGVSNGKLMEIKQEDSTYTSFHWKVINPINNYNISVNAGYYTEIRDSFRGIHTVPLSYYVLKYNANTAEKHFLQVHAMLKAYEHYFGAYPFFEDSYKLVETSYWGMEHQSCIAYGNLYRNNSFGFDFIIIHESGHEWFANSITASDPADMWIHESFTTYAEALYLEYTQNRTVATEYLLEQKKKIVSKVPMQGDRGVYYHRKTDSDIYYKGTWMLQTMRSVLNNDSLWFASIKGLNKTFYHSIIRTEDVIQYFNKSTAYNWNLFYKQYLYGAKIPVLAVKEERLKDGRMRYTVQLKQTVKGFTLPVHINGMHIQLNEKKQILVLDGSFDLYAFLRANYLLEFAK